MIYLFMEFGLDINKSSNIFNAKSKLDISMEPRKFTHFFGKKVDKNGSFFYVSVNIESIVGVDNPKFYEEERLFSLADVYTKMTELVEDKKSILFSAKPKDFGYSLLARKEMDTLISMYNKDIDNMVIFDSPFANDSNSIDSLDLPSYSKNVDPKYNNYFFFCLAPEYKKPVQ